MDEQQNQAAAEGAEKDNDRVDRALYDQLRNENESLLAQLEKVRNDMQAKEDLEKGRTHLKELVGTSDGPLFEKAVEKAEMEELAGLPYEKRYELGYLISLGEQAHINRIDGTSKVHPPRFAPSAGNSQVVLSAEKRPTTFAMAKENAKRYLNLKY